MFSSGPACVTCCARADDKKQKQKQQARLEAQAQAAAGRGSSVPVQARSQARSRAAVDLAQASQHRAAILYNTCTAIRRILEIKVPRFELREDDEGQQYAVYEVRDTSTA